MKLLHALRAERSLDHTLIVAVTGYGQEEDRRRSMDVGIDAHLAKPVEPGDVNPGATVRHIE